MKGISPDGFGVTIHASSEFSQKHWDDDNDKLTQLILEKSDQWLGSKAIKYQVHRWRYGQAIVSHPESCLYIDKPAPLVFAGDAFGKASCGIETAFISGLNAAETLPA